ncbi:MAG: HD domain-containing protein [Elusimicrobia bacterium]|nr:HD domain-containing protein [Elusimicrobiota bacterium]
MTTDGNPGSLPKELSERFDAALLMASRLHHRKPRKGTDIPYLLHILGVVGAAKAYGATEDEAIAALLHDAIEDQGGPPAEAEVREHFGANVAAIVRGCTDTDSARQPDWRARKESFVARLRTASPSVRLIQACDKLQTARAVLADWRVFGETVWARCNGGKDGTLWYYRAVVGALGQAGGGPLVEELDRAVSELESLTGEGQAKA